MCLLFSPKPIYFLNLRHFACFWHSCFTVWLPTMFPYSEYKWKYWQNPEKKKNIKTSIWQWIVVTFSTCSCSYSYQFQLTCVSLTRSWICTMIMVESCLKAYSLFVFSTQCATLGEKTEQMWMLFVLEKSTMAATQLLVSFLRL